MVNANEQKAADRPMNGRWKDDVVVAEVSTDSNGDGNVRVDFETAHSTNREYAYSVTPELTGGVLPRVGWEDFQGITNQDAIRVHVRGGPASSTVRVTVARFAEWGPDPL